jgi:hypothetical protein
MFGLYDINGLSMDEIYTLMANVLINADKNCEKPMFEKEEPCGTFTFYPKHLNLFIHQDLTPLSTNKILFYLNARIYEIIKEKGYKFGYIMDTNKQHLLKLNRKAATFQNPLINLSYTITTYSNILNLINEDTGIFFTKEYNFKENTKFITKFIFTDLFDFKILLINGWDQDDENEFNAEVLEDFITYLKPNNADLCRMILLDHLMKNTENHIHINYAADFNITKIDKDKILIIHHKTFKKFENKNREDEERF